MVMNLLCQAAGDSGHRFDVLERGSTYRTGAAEMVQQRALAGGADARHLVERRAGDVGGAPGAMRADRESMRLVAQALEEIEHRVARLEREGRLARHEEALAAGVAVGPLGDADDGDVL